MTSTGNSFLPAAHSRVPQTSPLLPLAGPLEVATWVTHRRISQVWEKRCSQVPWRWGKRVVATNLSPKAAHGRAPFPERSLELPVAVQFPAVQLLCASLSAALPPLPPQPHPSPLRFSSCPVCLSPGVTPATPRTATPFVWTALRSAIKDMT